VLDTNIALDWLVFIDGGMLHLPQAIENGAITLLSTPATIAELKRVLAYKNFALSADAQAEKLARYLAICLPYEGGTRPLGYGKTIPRCRDRDDQIFLDLAVNAQAQVLASKDARVLATRGRMKALGVDVMAPVAFEAWLITVMA
jgi:uncharacterized protein